MLTKIALVHKVVLADSPYDNKTLVNSIHEILIDITEWYEHLTASFSAEDPPKAVDEEPKEDTSFSVDDMELQAESIDVDNVSATYYQDKKGDMVTFEKLRSGLTHFSSNINQIINDNIQAILNLQSLTEAKQKEDILAEEKTVFLKRCDFLLNANGSKLDRLLNLLMKLMD
jgi:hypothetical protein